MLLAVLLPLLRRGLLDSPNAGTPTACHAACAWVRFVW